MPASSLARPKFSRCHYQQVAAVLNHRRASFDAPERSDGGWAVDWIADDFCELFAADNPRFDRRRFLIACGIGA
jgi:hypothetical protein